MYTTRFSKNMLSYTLGLILFPKIDGNLKGVELFLAATLKGGSSDVAD
jgi:hypothetical protein